jgi:hypothetical protein
MIKVSNILIKVSKKLSNDDLLNLGIKKLIKKYHLKENDIKSKKIIKKSKIVVKTNIKMILSKNFSAKLFLGFLSRFSFWACFRDFSNFSARAIFSFSFASRTFSSS